MLRSKKKVTTIKEQQAIDKARKYSRRYGYEPDDYEVTAKLAEGEWQVFFRGKELLPGNFFSVFINDQSGVVRELVPGK